MTDSIHLRDLTSPQIRDATARGTVLLLPFGQTEEHGHHLPIGSDTIIAEKVAEEAARKCQGHIPVLVAPSIQYGYSNEIMRQWPGTFIVRPQVLIDLLVDVCCSAVKTGFRKVAIISGHGHHVGICRVAIRQVFDEVGVNVVFTQPSAFAKDTLAKIRKSGPGGVCHAGEYETSIMMHLGYPVDLSQVDDRDRLHFNSDYVSGDGIGGSKSGSVFWSTWGLQDSESGAYGDPTVSNAESGQQLMQAAVDEYCLFLAELYRWEAPAQPLPRP